MPVTRRRFSVGTWRPVTPELLFARILMCVTCMLVYIRCSVRNIFLFSPMDPKLITFIDSLIGLFMDLRAGVCICLVRYQADPPISLNCLYLNNTWPVCRCKTGLQHEWSSRSWAPWSVDLFPAKGLCRRASLHVSAASRGRRLDTVEGMRWDETWKCVWWYCWL